MGRLHVGEMLSELSSRDFGEWLAWHQMEPRNGKRLEPYMAQLAQLIYNANWTKKLEIDKFEFDFEKKEEVILSPQDQAEAIKAMYLSVSKPESQQLRMIGA